MTYIIVIDVDNKRALAAYQKGWNDIQRLWPQVEAYCAERDAKALAKWEEREAEKVERQKKFDAACEAYGESKKKVEEWHASSPFTRLTTTCPVEAPMPGYDYIRGSVTNINYKPGRYIDKFESIRNDLKHMLDIAGAATGPYRMTEHQVADMVKWEDDTHTDNIRKEMEQGGGVYYWTDDMLNNYWDMKRALVKEGDLQC